MPLGAALIAAAIHSGGAVLQPCHYQVKHFVKMLFGGVQDQSLRNGGAGGGETTRPGRFKACREFKHFEFIGGGAIGCKPLQWRDLNLRRGGSRSWVYPS